MNNKLLPHYVVAFDINSNDQPLILNSIQFAFKQLKWSIDSFTENKIEGHTSLSLSSWGESIVIHITETKVTLESKCIGTQLFDWGKNKKNIESLLQQIKLHEQRTFTTYEVAATDTQPSNFDAVNKVRSSFKDYLQIFIPTKDYFFTPIVIFLNIIVFLLMAIDGTSIIAPAAEDLIQWGANERSLTLNGELWRLFSCIFVHIGIIHLIMNLYALIFIGSLLEPIIGKYRFIIGYMISGFVASTASLWWNTFALSAGASGAIFGLFGIFLALLTTNYLDKAIRKSMLTYILIYIGLNLITGMKEGIDAAAHLGGLISGFAIGYAFYYGLINKESKELNYWILGVVSFLGISGSYLTLEKIPNPIKNYRSNDGRKLNYFDVYDVKMKDFEGNEMLALEIKNKSDYNREEILHYIDNHTLYYWKKNLKIVNEIEKFSLPEEVLKKNEILKKYVLLRIQQTQLIKQKIETKSDKFNKKLIETNQEIENIIDVLVNL